MTSGSASASSVVDRFNDAWNRHDLDAALELITDDCVFEATGPAPDGARHTGKKSIAQAWAPIFADQQAHFEVEAAIVDAAYVVQQWTYRWGTGHVRGIDVIRLTDGRISAKLSYVKG